MHGAGCTWRARLEPKAWVKAHALAAALATARGRHESLNYLRFWQRRKDRRLPSASH